MKEANITKQKQAYTIKEQTRGYQGEERWEKQQDGEGN